MNLIEARELFKKITTTQICDAAKKIQVFNPSLKSFTHKPKMLGKAWTVKADGDLLPVIKSLELATDEHVIVVDSGGSDFALAGELLTSEAKRKNIAGFVIDGFCRDADSITSIGVPFFAKGICPKAGSKNKLGEMNVPIKCGGVTVSAGDIVIGDENGIVTIDMDELFDCFKLALSIVEREERALVKINSGTSLLDLFNFREHYQNVSLGIDSSFKWEI